MKRSRSAPVAMGVLATGGALIAGLLSPAAGHAAQPVTIDVVSGRPDTGLSVFCESNSIRSMYASVSRGAIVPMLISRPLPPTRHRLCP